MKSARMKKTGGAKNPKSPASSNPRRRRNPAGAEPTAAELSEQFHGRPAHQVTEIEEIELHRAELADLGRLKELHVDINDEVFAIPFYATTVKLGASPDGRNLYFVGGNQDFDLSTVGIESDKDQTPIGDCVGIVYGTRKGFHNFEQTDYSHEFGEETGEVPTLEYSSLNKKFYLSGGAYQVKPEGIVN